MGSVPPRDHEDVQVINLLEYQKNFVVDNLAENPDAFCIFDISSYIEDLVVLYPRKGCLYIIYEKNTYERKILPLCLCILLIYLSRTLGEHRYLY